MFRVPGVTKKTADQKTHVHPGWGGGGAQYEHSKITMQEGKICVLSESATLGKIAFFTFGTSGPVPKMHYFPGDLPANNFHCEIN